MLIVQNKRYIKKHIVGGAGIFDTIKNFFKRVTSSNAAKLIASAATKAAASDLGKTAISAAKTAGKEIATSAISAAKDLAIEKGKQLIDKASAKASAHALAKASAKASNPPVINKKTKDILASLISGEVNSGAHAEAHAKADALADEATTNINKMLMGSAIRIEDLVKANGKKKNANSVGYGLRMA